MILGAFLLSFGLSESDVQVDEMQFCQSLFTRASSPSCDLAGTSPSLLGSSCAEVGASFPLACTENFHGWVCTVQNHQRALHRQAFCQ